MFREITLNGDARTRGETHGRLLAEEIRAAVEIYLRLLPQPIPVLADLAIAFRRHIVDYARDYAVELDAIAAAAEVPPWQIYALNARTELLNAAHAGNAGECTAVYFEQPRLLAQNWDWLAALEPLCVLARIRRSDGHRFITFTEPGMLAKIGMNHCGLGVCLNILDAPTARAAVPVHVVLRAVLDAADLAQARDRIARAGLNKASHLLLADDQGGCCGIEFAPAATHALAPRDGVLVHTNHYLAEPQRRPRNPQSTSYCRLDTARARLAAIPRRDLQTLRELLLDSSEGHASINSPYRERADFAGMSAGTVASVIMDLPARTLHVSRGNDPWRVFQQVPL